MVLHRKGALFTPFESQLDEIKKPRAKTKRQIVSSSFDILCISHEPVGRVLLTLTIFQRVYRKLAITRRTSQNPALLCCVTLP